VIYPLASSNIDARFNRFDAAGQLTAPRVRREASMLSVHWILVKMRVDWNDCMVIWQYKYCEKGRAIKIYSLGMNRVEATLSGRDQRMIIIL